MVFWGVEIKAGASFQQVPLEEESNLHVSQATLGLSPKQKERTVITAKVGEDDPIIICSLTPGLLESCPLDLIFDEDVTFTVIGPTSVHLTGYYMPSQFVEEDENFGEEYSTDDEDDDLEADEMLDSEEDGDDEDSLMDIRIQNSGVIIEEITDDNPVLKGQNPAAVKVIEVTENGKSESAAEEKEDEDGLIQGKKRSASDEPVVKVSKKQATTTISDKAAVDVKKKGMKATAPVPEPAPAPVQVAAPVQLAAPVQVAAPAQESAAEVGKEIPPAVKVTAEVQGKKKKKKKAKAEDKPSETTAKPQEPTKASGSETQEKTVEAPKPTEAKKEPSKKEIKDPATETEKTAKPKPSVKKFPNGLEIHSLSFGKPNANLAKQGKKVFMSYTGRLKSNGKIFDSNVKGKPFGFRLGVGEVIKGWDVGVQGMRVGDKRKLVIPPAMGYGAKGAGSDIPGNAWLEFDIELKEVK